MTDRLVGVVRGYLDALARSDMEYLKALFTDDGIVHSAFLGEVPKDEFFDKLGRSSTRNVITLIDIMPSATGARRVAAYFRYQWTVRDGSVIDFKCIDVFDFDDATELMRRVTIVMDTHRILMEHGNKYEK